MKARDWHPLTDEALAELTRRALAGEKRQDLAVEFDVPRSWVSAARATAKDPFPADVLTSNLSRYGPERLVRLYADSRVNAGRALRRGEDAQAKDYMAAARAACRWWAAKTRTPKKEARAACGAFYRANRENGDDER